MIRRILLLSVVLAACGDNKSGDFDYTNPPSSTGKLRLVKTHETEKQIDLSLVVGAEPLTGYSVGFNLPVGHHLVQLVSFTPGTALDPGSAPVAAHGALPIDGPLADHLVVGLSQKAAGTGAVDADKTVAAGAVLLTVRLQKTTEAQPGVVFDGTDASFLLPSGGMRDKSGTTVVEPTDVAIGKLEIN